MWQMEQKWTVLVLLCLVGSALHTEGAQSGIICHLLNEAGGVVQSFNQYDCSSCWFHCIMSPTCVKMYYTYDGACYDEESQVEKLPVQSEDHFRPPSETCLQLDEWFVNPLPDGCPPEMSSVRRNLDETRFHYHDFPPGLPRGRSCRLFSYGQNLFADMGDFPCDLCQQACLDGSGSSFADCESYYYSNENLCLAFIGQPWDNGWQCPENDDQTYIPLPHHKPCHGLAFGEPHFKGFGDQPFEFQGVPGGIFNIYTDPAHQVNALLASIGHPDLTYIVAVGFMYGPNKVKVLVSVQHCVPKAPKACRLQVQVGDKPVVASEGRNRVTAVEGEVKLQVTNGLQGAQHVLVFTPALSINMTKGIDGLHLDVNLSPFPGVWSSEAHGVLGQTLRWPPHKPGRLVGDEMDYLASHLFATDSKFDRFVAANASAWHVREIVQKS